VVHGPIFLACLASADHCPPPPTASPR
jgi:hypothetical protein